MVWSKVDFEREVRRQLIELRALRRRVPATDEVLQRIERLEASHHTLLRKLNEYFRANEAPQKPTVQEPDETVVEPVVSSPGFSGESQLENHVSAGNLAVALKTTQKVFPTVTEKCLACEKLLLPTILAGGEVVCQEPGWFHASCLKGGEPFGKQGTLN